MNSIRVLIVVNGLLLTFISATRAAEMNPAQRAIVARIETLGGNVSVDEDKSHGLATYVNCAFSQIADTDLEYTGVRHRPVAVGRHA
jgi:hypothetical protein